MVKVPEPLRYVFDSFPLRTYPSVMPEVSNFQNDEFCFESEASPTSNGTNRKFCLAVHNVQRVQLGGTTKVIPTDPFALNNSLILCFRHGLKMPSEPSKNKSSHSLRTVSYLASADNELPLLIDLMNSLTDHITNAEELANSVASRYFSADTHGYLINHYLDGLKDLWILALLCDIPGNSSSEYLKLFYEDPELLSNSFTLKLASLQLATQMPSWNDFRTRYPHLFQSRLSRIANFHKNTLQNLVSSIDSEAINEVYQQKLKDFERNVPLIMGYLETVGNNDSKTIIELKLVSFIFVIANFISERTKIGSLIQDKFQHIVKHSEEVVSIY